MLENFRQDRLDAIENIKTVKDYPVGMATSKILLKIIMTDSGDKVTEKTIKFDIPMGC